MARQKNKQVESVSTSEIKSWLRGILEFQNGDWIPNKQQWGTIKEKIFALEETTVTVVHDAPEYIPYETRRVEPVAHQAVAAPAYSPLGGPSDYIPQASALAGQVSVGGDGGISLVPPSGDAPYATSFK